MNANVARFVDYDFMAESPVTFLKDYFVSNLCFNVVVSCFEQGRLIQCKRGTSWRVSKGLIVAFIYLIWSVS